MNNILVIIPHYNKVALLKECLLHLQNQSLKTFDVLIVDNGSSDGSVTYINDICETNKNFNKILLNENLGFAGGVNKGFEFSLSNNYEYSILLNNDAYVDFDFVKNIYEKITNDDNFFAVSSMMINYHNKDLIDSFGDNYCLLGWQFQNHIGEKVLSFVKDEYCFSACGGASIYRNSIIKKIGFLDDKFFAYLEDIDLSYRAKLNGYKICTCYNAKCYHLGSATSGSKYNDFKVKISARNSIYLLYKNMPSVQLLINIIPLLFGYTIKFFFFLSRGFGKMYLLGLYDGINTRKNIIRVDFKNISFIRFFIIEIELIANTFKYIINFFKRHFVK